MRAFIKVNNNYIQVRHIENIRYSDKPMGHPHSKEPSKYYVYVYTTTGNQYTVNSYSTPEEAEQAALDLYDRIFEI